MRKPKPLNGPRPEGHRVFKEVELPDGQVIRFKVLVIDPPKLDEDRPRKVRPRNEGEY